MPPTIRTAVIASTFASLALAGCNRATTAVITDPPVAKSSPEAISLLKKSMDAYHHLKSFQADYGWTQSVKGAGTSSAGRTFEYEAPNRFRAESVISANLSMTSVCDGKHIVEYSTVSQNGAPGYTVPARSSELKDPMACGTLLYKFFGGSSGFDKLVDETKKPVLLGAEQQEKGEQAREVSFYATGPYGNTDVLIGETSGKVYAISYDGAGASSAQPRLSDTTPGPTVNSANISTEEQYTDVKFNPTLASADFAAVVPKTSTVAANASALATPIPLGSPAPDFKVTPVNGGHPISLKALRGKPVLVDFWATWCGPCRLSLPHTEAAYKDFASKGLQVLTISQESPDTIKAFIAKNKYTFPAYCDSDHQATEAYKVDGIPTILIIDKNGTLRNYMVGYQEESVLRDALKKVGIG